MKVFEGDRADRLPHSPPDSHHTWAPQGMETAKPTVPRFYTQPFNNTHKQNCINQSLFLQLINYFRQTSHEEALTCSRTLLPSHCWPQTALPGGDCELPSRHKAHLLTITSCQLVKQQDKRKHRPREQCTFLPGLQRVEGMPRSFCPWK